jgi:hypothetical protein
MRRLRTVPEPSTKRSLDSISRVSAAIRDLTNCILLLERKPRRQRPKPATGTSERRTTSCGWIVGCDVADQLQRAPGDGAGSSVDELAESRDPVVTDEAIWILSVAEQTRFDDPKGRCPTRATSVFDSPSDPISPSNVVVEGEHDRFDAMSIKPSERRRRHACTAGRDDRRVAVPAEMMNVDQPLDEDDLSALCRRETKNL